MQLVYQIFCAHSQLAEPPKKVQKSVKVKGNIGKNVFIEFILI